MAERLLDKAGSKDKKTRKAKAPPAGAEEANGEGEGAKPNPLGDDRFGAMFESEAFEIDPQSEEYARAHP
ncbi:unnamed protein product, partial [Hapterophycus canaliculatus]